MTGSMELQAMIGFNGSAPHGLTLHPAKDHLVYPLGSIVVLREIREAQKQEYLVGHSDTVTCVAVSKSGRYIASGQSTHMGFQADVIVWDFETRSLKHRLTLHNVKIQSLDFSADERFLATLGGPDDNNVVIWDVESGTPICGSPAANDLTKVVKFLNNSNNKFVTGGNYNLRIWQIDVENRKAKPLECSLGQTRRIITSVHIDVNDEYMYCGTTTGDIVEVSLHNGLLQRLSAPKDKFSRGVVSLTSTKLGDLIAGAGDGTVALIKKHSFRPVKTTKVMGAATSLTAMVGDFVFCGTNESNIYRVNIRGQEMSSELRSTCHFGPITDVAFPHNYSEVFATCSTRDIRIWNARTYAELLRIQVPNLDCNCVTFSKDGKYVISGWSDGAIRAFGPQTGKLVYAIGDAHQGGVTSIACTNDCQRVLSGGADGCVRVWRATRESQSLIFSMKEHKQSVNSICIESNDTQAVSASDDGTCIIWNLVRFVRSESLLSNTFFKCVIYNDDESQLLTCGTDRKITYWDNQSGQSIREIGEVNGVESEEINAVALSSSGKTFVSGGVDKLVKLWNYDEGFCNYVGEGHSGAITSVKLSPDNSNCISVGAEGAIIIWAAPPEE